MIFESNISLLYTQGMIQSKEKFHVSLKWHANHIKFYPPHHVSTTLYICLTQKNFQAEYCHNYNNHIRLHVMKIGRGPVLAVKIGAAIPILAAEVVWGDQL